MAVTLAAVLASGVAFADETDPFTLHIAIGRMAVMTGQGEMALGLLPAKAQPKGETGVGETGVEETGEVTSPQALYVALYETVLAYNRLQAKACARHAVAADLCERPFYPRWLKVPGTTKASLEKIRKWADETAQRVGPLTGALCGRAVEKGADPTLCAIE